MVGAQAGSPPQRHIVDIGLRAPLGLTLAARLACMALLVAALGGCGDAPASPDPDDGHAGPPALFETLDAPATAAALADAETVAAGVRSLVANLGLGVYRAHDLEQLHAGSERGPDDVWLYDFELSALAQMALGPAAPFLDFVERLTAVGYDQDADALLQSYRDAYAGSTAFLPALFAAQDLDLHAPPASLSITPLQEWLLLLDGFVPPNPQQAVAADAGVERAVHRCSGIVGAAASNWGHGQPPRPPGMVDPSLLANLMTAVHMMSRRLEPAFAEVHERHPDHDPALPPHSLDFSATVAFHDLPDVLILCGYGMWQWVLQPRGGGEWGLRDVVVWWDVPDVLAFDRGEIRTADGSRWFPGAMHLTDAAGTAALTFHARDEPAEGEGVLRTELVPVTARFDVTSAMSQLLGGIDPFLLGYLPATLDPFPPHQGVIVIEVGWHEAATSLSAFAMEHPMGWPKRYGLAGAHVGLVPWNVHDRESQPPDMPLPVLDECGFWTQGLDLSGEHAFEASATAPAGVGRMRTETSVDEDGEVISIAFAGSAAANPVSSVASMALASAETGAVSGDHTLAGPGMLVVDVINANPGEALVVELSWSIDGAKQDPHDYASWWAYASLGVYGCGGLEDERTLFMVDDEEPDLSAEAHVVLTEDERIQLHILLEAGVYAQAFEVSHEPDVISSAQIAGELLITVRGEPPPGR